MGINRKTFLFSLKVTNSQVRDPSDVILDENPAIFIGWRNDCSDGCSGRGYPARIMRAKRSPVRGLDKSTRPPARKLLPSAVQVPI